MKKNAKKLLVITGIIAVGLAVYAFLKKPTDKELNSVQEQSRYNRKEDRSIKESAKEYVERRRERAREKAEKLKTMKEEATALIVNENMASVSEVSQEEIKVSVNEE